MPEKMLCRIDRDLFRTRLNPYTERAFRMLPELDSPRILDVGCGSGIPTLELARLCDGEIIGVDIDRGLLRKLARRIEREGLADRVKVVEGSLFDLDFPEEWFDVIWAEGSIAQIGFERGLRVWGRFLKSGGFLVVHDDIGDLAEKLELISRWGYALLEHFTLSNDVWWDAYYGPLEERVQEIRSRGGEDSDVAALLDREQEEIEMFRKNPERYRSVFFVMQKG